MKILQFEKKAISIILEVKKSSLTICGFFKLHTVNELQLQRKLSKE